MLRVALTHYAPVPDTLAGEPPEIYRYLGSDLLGQAIDAAGADLAIHGHAHFGIDDRLPPLSGAIPFDAFDILLTIRPNSAFERCCIKVAIQLRAGGVSGAGVVWFGVAS